MIEENIENSGEREKTRCCRGVAKKERYRKYMEKDGKIIVVMNQKGGVGKTTTTVNLGAALNSMGKKVLLIDADSQAHLTISLGIRKSNMDKSLENLLRHTISEMPVDIMSFVQKSDEGIDILASNKMLAGMEHILDSITVMKEAIKGYKDIYDYILIDCMPSLGMLSNNALYASDKVIIPMVAEIYSADGFVELMSSLIKLNRSRKNPVEILGVLYNKDKEKLKNNREIKETVGSLCKEFTLNVKPFSKSVPDYAIITEAATNMKSIFAHESKYKEQLKKVRDIYIDIAKIIVGEEK